MPKTILLDEFHSRACAERLRCRLRLRRRTWTSELQGVAACGAMWFGRMGHWEDQGQFVTGAQLRDIRHTRHPMGRQKLNQVISAAAVVAAVISWRIRGGSLAASRALLGLNLYTREIRPAKHDRHDQGTG